MFFDTTLQIFSLDVQAVVPDEGEEGDGHVILSMLVGIAIPTPQGRQVLPVGVVKVPVGRDLAIAKAEELKVAAEKLPEPRPDSDLLIAGNMEQAKAAVEMDEAIRSGHIPDAA